MEKERKKVTFIYATTSKIPVALGIISKVKLNFQLKIKAAQSKLSIPDDLIINFDQILFALQITFYTNVEQRVFLSLVRA